MLGVDVPSNVPPGHEPTVAALGPHVPVRKLPTFNCESERRGLLSLVGSVKPSTDRLAQNAREPFWPVVGLLRALRLGNGSYVPVEIVIVSAERPAIETAVIRRTRSAFLIFSSFQGVT